MTAQNRRRSLEQRMAELADKQKQLVELERKLRTRGLILLAVMFIARAQKDEQVGRIIFSIVQDVGDNDREAVQTALKNLDLNQYDSKRALSVEPSSFSDTESLPTNEVGGEDGMPGSLLPDPDLLHRKLRLKPPTKAALGANQEVPPPSSFQTY